MPAYDLSQEDWQFIQFAVQARFNGLRPKKGEPPASAAAKAEEARIMTFLNRKVYPREQ